MGSRARSVLAVAGWALIALALHAVWGRGAGVAVQRPKPARPAATDRRRGPLWLMAIAAGVVLVVAGAAAVYRAELARADRAWAMEITGGDPDRAPALMIAHGCTGCHEIPGIAGAHGRVGPRLAGLAERVYIAGRLENTAPNLVQWIRQARAIDPETVMPSTGISEREARDIAAYLYAQR